MSLEINLTFIVLRIMPLANIDFPRGGKRPHTDEKTEVVEAKELFQVISFVQHLRYLF